MAGYYSNGRRPCISKNDLEDEATSFLRINFPMALDFPIAVPIVQIANDMGVTMIAHERLTEDFSVMGQMCFTDGIADIYREDSDEYVELQVSKGTMLIDPYTKLVANTGCFNNTVAHETFHWYRHRDYFEALAQKGNQAVYALRCNRDQIEGQTRGSRNTDIDWIEWQATCIAPRILMPCQTFERVAQKSIDESRRYYNSDKGVYNQMLHDVMDCYHVSYTSAAIRFQELGLARLLC